MKVEIKLLDNFQGVLPSYSTSGSSGMDVRSVSKYTIPPKQRRMIPTGFAMGIPEGYEVQVRPRSGLALKKGITVLNSPGTIDSDFTGEIGIILMNTGDSNFHINIGDRIAQLVLTSYTKADLEVVTKLTETDRGSGGFGSTGV